ncbi:MAG: OmpA family protein [Verrucomicrobiales bacterium]|nr:OmpA family protein [Verrucomicrobiales bacterium]
MQSNYSWQNATGHAANFKSESTRNIGWWILLAIVISIVLHLVLYFTLGLLKWQAQMTPGFKEEIVFQNRQKEQLIIDQETLENFLPKPPQAPEPITPEKMEGAMPLLDDTLDEFDILDQLPDKEIKLTPAVDSTQIFSNIQPAAPKKILVEAAEQIDVAAANLISKDLQNLREKLIEDSPVVSNVQPVLELNMDDITKGVDTDEFFRRAAARVSSSDGGSDITRGFSSLDGLLGKTGGGIPDGTKPILMPTDLLFGYNQWELREEARLSMMKLGFIIQTNPNSKFIIEGHTDTIGGADANYQLSLRRAGAVRDWLIEVLKIDGNNMQAVGYGKSRPLVNPNGNPNAQALNRRVEIVIKK